MGEDSLPNSMPIIIPSFAVRIKCADQASMDQFAL